MKPVANVFLQILVLAGLLLAGCTGRQALPSTDPGGDSIAPVTATTPFPTATPTNTPSPSPSATAPPTATATQVPIPTAARPWFGELSSGDFVTHSGVIYTPEQVKMIQGSPQVAAAESEFNQWNARVWSLAGVFQAGRDQLVFEYKFDLKDPQAAPIVLQRAFGGYGGQMFTFPVDETTGKEWTVEQVLREWQPGTPLPDKFKPLAVSDDPDNGLTVQNYGGRIVRVDKNGNVKQVIEKGQWVEFGVSRLEQQTNPYFGPVLVEANPDNPNYGEVIAMQMDGQWVFARVSQNGKYAMVMENAREERFDMKPGYSREEEEWRFQQYFERLLAVSAKISQGVAVNSEGAAKAAYDEAVANGWFDNPDNAQEIKWVNRGGAIVKGKTTDAVLIRFVDNLGQTHANALTGTKVTVTEGPSVIYVDHLDRFPHGFFADLCIPQYMYETHPWSCIYLIDTMTHNVPPPAGTAPDYIISKQNEVLP